MRNVQPELLLALLAGSVSFLACGQGEPNLDVNETNVSTEDAQINTAANGFAVLPEGQFFRYSKLFDRKFVFSDFEYGVDVFTREFYDDVWYTWQKSFTTSFAIEHIRGRTSEEYVVGGYDEQTGETVLEGWRFTTPDGAYASLRSPAASSVMGTTIPLSVRSVDIKTGTFIPPASRGITAPPQRQVLYRGTEFRLKDFVIDPDGRYIIVQDATAGGIFQVHNQQATIIASPQNHPLLLGATDLQYIQNSNVDRVLEMTTQEPYPHKTFILHDANNDGVIEFIGSVLSSDFVEDFPMTYPVPGGPPIYDFVR